MHYYQDISHFRAPYKNIPVAGFGAHGSRSLRESCPPPLVGVYPHCVAPVPAFIPGGGFGADEPAVVSTYEEPPADPREAFFELRQGVPFFKPEVAQVVMGIFELSHVIAMQGTWPNSSMTYPQARVIRWTEDDLEAAKTDEDLRTVMQSVSAAGWVRNQVQNGNAVLAPWWIVNVEAVEDPKNTIWALPWEMEMGGNALPYLEQMFQDPNVQQCCAVLAAPGQVDFLSPAAVAATADSIKNMVKPEAVAKAGMGPFTIGLVVVGATVVGYTLLKNRKKKGK